MTGVLITAGIVTTSLGILMAPPITLPAAADELKPFDDCEELRQWYVDTTLPRVTAWGLDGWPGVYDGLRTDFSLTSEAATSQDAGKAVGNNETGTNVQEAGVDEPDVAKTNGRLVVHVADRQLVITDASGDEPRRLSRIDLPRDIYQPELLLIGDTVLAFGSTSGYGGYPIIDSPIVAKDSILPSRSTTVISSIDISAPTAPRIERTEHIDGHLVSAREYDGTVRAVISTPTPDLPFVSPEGTLNRKGNSDPGGDDPNARDARAENRRIVREATIEQWLPNSRTITPGVGTTQGPLMDCTDVRHPAKHSGLGTLSVLTFDAGSPVDREATGITAGGELVYSSTDRLYIATTDYGWGEPVPLLRSPRTPIRKPNPPTTEVHAFAIDGTDTAYVASGTVRGTVRDRWSFSEYDGHLRVATALGRDSWNPRENAVFVLEERGGRLVTVGSAGGMGLREQIQSVRWFGDVAVVVTFRQVDPLYTIDLSDPTDPEVLGELKIPGFSSYLHPIGDDLLLGIGQDATKDGQATGAQAATFDIGELTDPVRLDTEEFARNTELATSWDPRAFTYLPERRIALSPVQNYYTGSVRLAVFEIAEDGALTRTTEPVGGVNLGAVRALPLDEGNVAVVAGGEVSLVDLI